ncbi:MAG: hypothetical protein IT532_05125 [Burkholderiales bacterium]|nr:hypothetical protein [Burkholderiales bacterium]
MTRTAAIAVAFALGASLLAPAHAERGSFKGHAVLNSTKFTEYKALDGHPMKGVMSGEMEGLVFHDGGDRGVDQMLDRAHYHVAWVGDGGGSGYCLKTFTTKDGHKLFARCDSKWSSTAVTGTVTLLGGTGPFAGISGKGKFNFVFVTPVVNWDDIEWNWETP